MAPAEAPSQISLKVKVPPGFVSSSDSEQFDLGTVAVTTTLAALRQQIQQVVPTNPTPDRQRLLYGGRLLSDEQQTIGDLLSVKRDPAQGEYVVHLLIRGEASTSRAPTPSTLGRTQPSTTMPAAGGTGGEPAHNHQPQQQALPFQQQQQQQHFLNHHQHLTRQLQQQHFLQQVGHGQQPLRGGMPPPAPYFVQGGMAPRMVDAGMHGMPLEQTVHPTATNGGAQHQTGATQSQTQATEPQGQQTAQSQHTNPQLQQQQHPHHPQRRGQGFHIEGIGPNGQHFQIHQQMINHLGMHMPGAPPMGFPTMPHQHIPAMSLQPPPFAQPEQRAGPTALDQARENVAEMRSMLNELANEANGLDEHYRRRVADAQNRVNRLGEYIDPFHVGAANPGVASGRRSAPPRPPQHAPQAPRAFYRPPPPIIGPTPAGLPVGSFVPWTAMPPPPPRPYPEQITPDDVTAYLLSSPQHGPQAILFSPRHGVYTDTPPALQPTPTPTTQPQQTDSHPQQQGQAAADAAAPQNQNQNPERAAQAAQQQQDPLGLQPILAHFWLLLRVLIFAYFLLGANLGWQRPVILLGIGLGFWLLRLGVLGDGAAVRRWWEGIVGAPARPADGQGGEGARPAGIDGRDRVQPVGQAGVVPQAGERAAATGNDAQANTNALQNRTQQLRQRMPTPEQVAQRLLQEAEQRNNQRGNWLREQVRPVERAVALFVASLWPGIGEGYVRRIREEEERAERRLVELQERAREDEGAGEDGEKGETVEAERKDGTEESRVVEGSQDQAAGSASGIGPAERRDGER